MTRTPRSRSGYVLAGGVLSAALALTGTAVGAPHSGRAAAPTQRIELNARPTTVRVHENVTYSGRTLHIREGSTAHLQQKLSGKWSDVPNRAATVRNDSFTIRDDFRTAGRKTMRVRVGTVHSNEVYVTVTRNARHHQPPRR